LVAVVVVVVVDVTNSQNTFFNLFENRKKEKTKQRNLI
jgi:hypothetical protein